MSRTAQIASLIREGYQFTSPDRTATVRAEIRDDSIAFVLRRPGTLVALKSAEEAAEAAIALDCPWPVAAPR